MNKLKGISGILFAFGLVFLAAFLIMSPQMCYALLSPSYVGSVQDEGEEWWSELLALDEVKATVDGWFSNKMYDFSLLDDDPVVVAIIDSGIELEHEAFVGGYGNGANESAANVDPYDVLFRSAGGSVIGKNTVSENSQISDIDSGGHGTHVAGIVATLIHWFGLEKYIKIMPIMAGRPASGGSGVTFEATDVKEGINYALDHGADVINMSLESTQTEFKFVTDEWASKAIFVAAAGNGRQTLSGRLGYDSASKKVYPAADEQVIGVMNVSNERDAQGNLQLSASSNYGAAYDLCAPGALISSAKVKTDNEYWAKSGTSMAAPVVSFASALSLLKFRAIEEATGAVKTVDEVREIVKFASTTYISKGNYQLNVLNLKKLAASEDSILARVEMESGYERQQMGKIRPIPVALRVLPSELEGQGSVEWALNDPDGEKIGEGFDFVFTPRNEHGKQLLYARWSVDTEEGQVKIVARHTIYVDYAKMTADSAKSLTIGILGEDGGISKRVDFESGKTYVISFGEAGNYDPDSVKNFKWLVNGEIAGAGRSFEFKPTSAGKYEICMRYNNVVSSVVTIEISPHKSEVKAALEYASYALIAVIGIAIVTTVVVIVVKRNAKR